jgi:hypothetical protein
MKRLFQQDGVTGEEIWFHDDPANDGFKLEYKQDCDPILENLKEIRNANAYKGKEFWYAGSIPNYLWLQWANEAGVQPSDPAMIEISKKKLNDGDWAFLRGGDFRL